VASIITAFAQWEAKSEAWPERHISIFKWNVIFLHIQFLTGLIIYFISPKVQFGVYTMKVSHIRFFTVEHALMMLIVVVMLTIVWVKTKRMDSVVKRYKTQFIYNLIALIIVIAMIPWPFRNLGGMWF
jgi:hypothetical protein